MENMKQRNFSCKK